VRAQNVCVIFPKFNIPKLFQNQIFFQPIYYVAGAAAGGAFLLILDL
jgi:hypothetical protein